MNNKRQEQRKTLASLKGCRNKTTNKKQQECPGAKKWTELPGFTLVIRFTLRKIMSRQVRVTKFIH